MLLSSSVTNRIWHGEERAGPRFRKHILSVWPLLHTHTHTCMYIQETTHTHTQAHPLTTHTGGKSMIHTWSTEYSHLDTVFQPKHTHTSTAPAIFIQVFASCCLALNSSTYVYNPFPRMTEQSFTWHGLTCGHPQRDKGELSRGKKSQQPASL